MYYIFGGKFVHFEGDGIEKYANRTMKHFWSHHFLREASGILEVLKCFTWTRVCVLLSFCTDAFNC